MDPNATLERIRDLQNQLKNGGGNDPDAYGDIALDIAHAVDDLDTWISNGGCLPDAWNQEGQHG